MIPEGNDTFAFGMKAFGLPDHGAIEGGRSGFFCAPVPALRVFESVHAVEPAGRLFRESKHRSRRVLKKLIRRHGGELVMKPCSYMMGDTIVVHPSIAKALREQISTTVEDAIKKAISG